MVRQPNTNSRGGSFSDKEIDEVWRKGKATNDPTIRLDTCNTKMRKSDYGKNTTMGWEIDHIVPVSRNGSDNLSNLQPLQWENNRRKADKYPWSC